VVSVRIVPPTSQNQGRIEEDLISLGPRLAAAPDEEVKRLCEQSVRNYDPCISCSTHFLKVNIERRGGPDVGEGSPGAAAASERKPRVAVIGCGSQGRGDDAAGLMVARRLRGQVGAEVSIREVAGDGLEVLEEWAGCSKVILVDAMVSGAPVGSVRRLDGRRLLGLEWPQLSSTHSLGLREALRVSETLGLSPQGLVVIGIEGGQFGPGDPISAGVVEGIQGAVSAVLDELASLDGQCLDE
jgi:hydrogenase maturation protease